MSMELISKEEALDCVRWGYSLSDCYEKISNVPTVKAIPLEKLEQIRAEIAYAMDKEPAWKGQDNYVGGLEIALSIIDKAIKEQSEWDISQM